MADEQSPNSDETPPAPVDPTNWAMAMSRIAERSQHLVMQFLSEQQHGSSAPNIDPFKLGAPFFEMTTRLMSDPQYLMQAQLDLWQSYLNLWHHTSQRMLGKESEPVIESPPGDRRFRDPLWQESTLFDFVRQSYLLTARWLNELVSEVEGLDEKTRQKVDFYTRQFVDALSPSNFVGTNPEVLRTTLESGGENLIQGLENLIEDMERGRGQLLISMTDEDAFTIGENIACTPGQVIYQNDLMQLIQYTPTTDTVYKRPLLIIPPWINKYYILDLRAKNSFVKWAVDQGYTVFMISWVNPGPEHRDKTFESYIDEGLFAAMDQIEKATGERSINTVGYCLGGTMLAAALSILEQRGDDRINAASFFVTLTDFEEAGEVTVFIDEAYLDYLEQQMAEKGYLEARAMHTTFNMLRANDLIWSFVVNNYLLGKEPFPFDLLYWNSDSTNLPAAMHSYYLRNMYQQNKLIEPGGLTMLGHPIDLTQVQTPACFIAAKEDHIAPWKPVYRGARRFKGPVKFILGASGHIAGIINPPAANKYCYWTSTKKPKDPEAWLEAAERHDGSWWHEWHKWMSRKAGAQVAARNIEDQPVKPIEPAPGSYVKVRAESLDPAPTVEEFKEAKA